MDEWEGFLDELTEIENVQTEQMLLVERLALAGAIIAIVLAFIFI